MRRREENVPGRALRRWLARGALSLAVALLAVGPDALGGEGARAHADSPDERGARGDALSEARQWISRATELRARGRVEVPIALYAKALAAFEGALGPEHPDVASRLDDLGMLWGQKGDDALAEKLHVRALAIREAHADDQPVELALSLQRLGDAYYRLRAYERARPLYERALAMSEKTAGADHFLVAVALDNLAALRRKMGALEEAERLHRRALEIKNKVHGPDSLTAARSLNNLANVLMDQARYDEAEPMLLHAFGIVQVTEGADHPDLIVPLNGLASLYEARRDIERAVALRARATELSERMLSAGLVSGSEQQKRALLGSMQKETNATVSLHQRSAQESLSAARLSLTTVLRRKGRVIDALTRDALRTRGGADEGARATRQELKSTRAQLATAFMRKKAGDGSAALDARIRQLELSSEELESALHAPSEAASEAAAPLSIADVQAALRALSETAVLMEIVRYEPFNPRARSDAERWGAPRYAAYVLGGRGEPRSADLGDAAEIEADVRRFRDALTSSDGRDVADVGRQLDARIMQPVRALLGRSRTLFVSPDAALNLVPFTALVDEEGRYLVERFSFTYLASGRDLVRLSQAREPSRQSAVVIAAPAFDLGSSSGADAAGDGARGPRRLYFTPLPGTAEEATALGPLVPGAEIRTGRDATESYVKGITGPKLLHVATHGFYLGAKEEAVGAARGLALEPETPTGVLDDPMLRSALALGGANRAGVEGEGLQGEDGLLTAIEVVDLDLRGTRLVVLSACETAVGEARAGDGVHGLRRALALAGSETQVMSLWKVHDEATRDLMVGYYRLLGEGHGRSDALREVQLAMLARPETAHPRFWAAFIVSGDPRPLERAKPLSAPPPLPPSAGGCACVAARANGGGAAGWLSIAALAVARRRKMVAQNDPRRESI